MADTLTLSDYGKKELNRRLVLGHKTVTRGNFNISIEKLLSGDEESIGLLRGTKGKSCSYTKEKPVSRPKRSKKNSFDNEED